MFPIPFTIIYWLFSQNSCTNGDSVHFGDGGRRIGPFGDGIFLWLLPSWGETATKKG